MSCIKIPMWNSCSHINFTGTKEFSFKTPSLKWINGKKNHIWECVSELHKLHQIWLGVILLYYLA